MRFWLLNVLLIFACVPYFFIGESEPRFFGLPLWFLVSIGTSILIAALSIIWIWKRWE